MKGPSHQIDFMGLTTKSKYYNMSKNLSSNNLSYYPSLTQKRIRIHLDKILFISSSKALHFKYANIWWSNITNKLCYLLLFQVNMSRRTTGLTEKYEEYSLSLITNYGHGSKMGPPKGYHSYGFGYLWHWMC